MTENTPSEAMELWRDALTAFYMGKFVGHGAAQAAAAVIADALAERDAESERLRRALRNIRALATKRQNVCGPDGCLTDIECFASAALGSAKL